MAGKSPESSLIVRNIRICGRRTSVKLEAFEVQVLARICAAENITIHEFCEWVDRHPARKESSRTGRIRMAILDYFVALHDTASDRQIGEPDDAAAVGRNYKGSSGPVRQAGGPMSHGR